MVTLKQIAERAEVSHATVSDVIHENWEKKGISKKTRDRVLQIVREVDYKPNRVARSLAKSRTHMIGVKLPSLVYQYWATIATELERVAQKYSYHTFFSVPGDWQEEKEEILRLYEHQVDGLILSPRIPDKLEELYSWLKEKKFPFVLIGSKYTDEYPTVLDDNVGQARLAVNHLISLGHTRIAHICGNFTSTAGVERFSSYRQSLISAKIPVNEDYIVEGHYNIDDAKNAMYKLLKLKMQPTAVYCGNDLMAIGAINAIEYMGLKVPDDIAIVGHGDDIPFAMFHRIPLTTIRHPVAQITEIAVKVLIDIIEGKSPEQMIIECPGELIIRKSCGAA